MSTHRVMRYEIADFINTGTTELPVWSLLGLGVVKADESPSAAVDSSTDVNNRNASPSISGYVNKFAFDMKLVSGDAAQDALYAIGHDQLAGSDAELEYLRVELYSGTETARPARKFLVCAEVANIPGVGGAPVHVDGTLHQIGDFVAGLYNESTGTFTAS